MDLNPRVTLSIDLIGRCWKAGKLIVDNLAKPTTAANAMSAALSSHGVEKDVQKQAYAKMGECAACLWLGLDPITHLNWEAEPDHGIDIWYRSRKIDVKHTSRYEPKYLIWPVNKRHLFERKAFDTLLLTCRPPRTLELVGWCTKDFFRSNRAEATASHPDLTKGTWYIDSNLLRKFDNADGTEAERASVRP